MERLPKSFILYNFCTFPCLLKKASVLRLCILQEVTLALDLKCPVSFE